MPGRIVESRVTSHESRAHIGERGSALLTVLLLIVVLTIIGTVMVNLTLTEITIAYNQGDAVAAQYMAEAGISRAMYELSQNTSWAGVTDTQGNGSYTVTVTTHGTVRFIESTGTQGGGRQVLRAAVKVIPRFAMYTILANTTAAVGSGQAGLTVSNDVPSKDAGAVQANNKLVSATAITINTIGAKVVGALTAQGAIQDQTAANLCLTWPYRCDPAFGVLPFPRLDMDSAAATSYRQRAKATLDPVDGLNLYFRGGDATSRCNSGGAWNFGTKETQRCWDKYISDRGAQIGAAIANAVFYVEFNANERTQYTISTQPITHRASTGGNNNGATTLTINLPAGVVANDVMVAAIAVRGGSGTNITSVPAGWNLVPGGTNPIDNGTTLKMAIYYKVATASEPASYQWQFSSSQKASGGIQAYTNVDTASPIDIALGQTATTNASGQISTPNVITTLDGTMVVASFAIANGGSWTPPAGMSERYDIASIGGAPSTRTASEGADVLQATAGATGAKTATSTAGTGVVGITHIVALAPRQVRCTGLAANTVETLCVRAIPATDSTGSVVYANSDPRNVTGSIVVFRRASGTSVVGDIAFENVALASSNYSHTSVTGDPAFIAGGTLTLISSGSSAGRTAMDVQGFGYAFAGLDNPDGSNNLQGSPSLGVSIAHGANLINITLNGFIMSNGLISIVDSASNLGNVKIQYDSAVADNLPAAFTAATTGNVVLGISWSGGD